MKKYTFLPHTADIRIFVESDNIEDLFSVSLEAICSILISGEVDIHQQFTLEEFLEIESFDQSALLIDFLSDALVIMNKHKAIFPYVSIQSLEVRKLSAKIYGYPVDEFKEDIKAITYHEANIQQIENIFQTKIVLDI